MCPKTYPRDKIKEAPGTGLIRLDRLGANPSTFIVLNSSLRLSILHLCCATPVELESINCHDAVFQGLMS